MKRSLLIGSLLFVAQCCHAQNTTVTATVTDANMQPYAFSTGYAALVCPGNQAATYNGFSIPRSFTITGFDGTGTFTQVVYDVSVLVPTGCGYQWHITYKDGITNFITGTITSVTGSAVNESVAISAFAVLLPAPPVTTPPGGSSGQIQYNNSGTFGGISGSAVTPATGASTLTAGADTTTPLAIASHSVTQSATLLDVNNQSSVSKDTPLIVRGRGTGSFTPGAGAALFHIAQESQAAGFYGWVISNHTADVAKGVANLSVIAANVLDNGTSQICGGDPPADGGNNYGCLLFGQTIGPSTESMIVRTACTNCVTGIVPFAVQGEVSQSADLFDLLNSSGSVLSGFDNVGLYHGPAGAAAQIICSGQIALSTGAIGSGARGTNTLTCTGLSGTSDTISCTFSGDTNAVTGYAPSASGGITLKTWASTNTINVDQVNNTSGSITPGAATINCKGIR